MNCGFKLPDGAKFCYECGHKQDVSEEIDISPLLSSSGGIHDSVITGGRGGINIGIPVAGGSFHNGDTKKECYNCGNIIGSSNRSVKCSVCGVKFCETCEGDFRPTVRVRGEHPLCEKHYLEEKGRIERERIEREEQELLRKEMELKQKEFTNSIGMKFVKIPGRDYYMGKYQVTQKEWKAVMGYNPSHFIGDELPVEQVSWNDCQEYIERLNHQEGTYKYRLPTEEEWEHSCRAGSRTKYCFGNDERQLGNPWSAAAGTTSDSGTSRESRKTAG